MAEDKTGLPATPSPSAMTASGRYDSLTGSRSPYIIRALSSATVTIPGLFPPIGANGGTLYETPFQSVGARGVNNLASKLLLALLPPGSSFFRLTMDDFVVQKLMQKFPDPQGQQALDARGQFEEALGRVERAVCNKLEQVGARTVVFETLKQLLVAGNGLVQILDDGRLQLHTLHNYVVKRDMEGTPLEIVVKQTLSRMSLPEKARLIVDKTEAATPRNDSNADGEIDLYTRITRRAPEGKPGGAEKWYVYQEICGETIPGTAGSYPLDKSPWLPLRFTHITNEDYGRGFVEEYLGDVQSLESLSEAIVRFSSVAAKIIFLVNQGKLTDKKKIAQAKSGAVLDGDAKDVTVVQLDKMQDFRVASETADKLTKRLEQEFLLDSSVQRDAERVTAEEIRLLANALEMGLGGFYSILGEEFQRPLVMRMMFQMERKNQLPVLPKEAVRPSIVTGLEALGRNPDLQKLDVLVTGVAQAFGQPAVAQYVNVGGYIKRRGTALGIDMNGLIRSDQEVQQQQQQEQQASVAQTAAPAVVKAASDHAMATRQANAAKPQPGAQQPPAQQ